MLCSFILHDAIDKILRSKPKLSFEILPLDSINNNKSCLWLGFMGIRTSNPSPASPPPRSFCRYGCFGVAKGIQQKFNIQYNLCIYSTNQFHMWNRFPAETFSMPSHKYVVLFAWSCSRFHHGSSMRGEDEDERSVWCIYKYCYVTDLVPSQRPPITTTTHVYTA